MEISEGYELAYKKAAEILPKLVVAEAKDLHELESVQKFLKASIMSKQYDNYEVVANLVAKACSKLSHFPFRPSGPSYREISVLTVPKNSSNFNVDNIRICKILGAGIGSSRVMNGMVFRRGAEGEIKKTTNARVAVFACPFDLTQTETKVG